MSEAPYYRSHVFVCSNQRVEGHPRGCCADKDSASLRTYLKVKTKQLELNDVRINNAGCLDRCENGPVMVIYPEGVWYKVATRADMDEILESHIQGGNRVEHLMLSNED
ncbi:ferredoxin [Magnetospira sp. QH-2]|uniref:(2Fe-2S) ferredoxin domain-containing protein n=1 Tax=Magnetospira sp. (strain QH-2) TaxID=1288970 RepID=UPI0003E81179|nr:ferredoxin [Magnetospira sp. QH-2]CCQ75612.1 putative Ferredoxin [Magnetospira sp. QH-2]